MKIGLLLTKDTLRARHILECFESGARAHGDTCVWVDDYKNYRDQAAGTDVGVQVTYPNKHHGGSPQGKFRIDINEYYAKRGKRILTADTGHIRNQSDFELQVAADKGKHEVLFDLDRVETYKHVLREIHYQVGFCGLKRYADYCWGKRPSPDRWKLLEAKGVRLQPWRTKGEHILLIGQTVNGLSSQDTNIYEWYAKTIKKIREVTDRPIVFRHHPRISKIREHGSRVSKDVAALEKAIGKAKNFSRSDPSKYLMERDLENAWAAVSYTSNAAVTAVLHGIPTITCHESNMAWEVSGHDLSEIERPACPDRQVWTYKMAYAQWTCGEMQDGSCWAHLRPHALKPPTYRFEWR
jgi:hypothetical protein